MNKGKGACNNFITEVLRHVSFTFDHDVIANELRNHIEESTEYYMLKGFSEEEAMNRAVDAMGDALYLTYLESQKEDILAVSKFW